MYLVPPSELPPSLGGHPEEEEAEDEVDFSGCGDEPIEESEFLLILDEFHEHIENSVETVDPDITLDFQDSTLESIFPPPSCRTVCRIGLDFFKLGFILFFKPLSGQLKSGQSVFCIIRIK